MVLSGSTPVDHVLYDDQETATEARQRIADMLNDESMRISVEYRNIQYSLAEATAILSEFVDEEDIDIALTG